MTYEGLTAALRDLADPTLEAYQKKIVSDTGYPMFCIRMPALRKLAKRCAQQNLDNLLTQARWSSYEEVLAFGLAVAYEKVPLDRKLEKLWSILPRLDSWAMTDTIAPTLKVTDAERPVLWEFAGRCMDSPEEYILRFGIVLLLDHFLTGEWIPRVEKQVRAVSDERYYVQMAAAWLWAEMAVYEPERVIGLLQTGELDRFTHNMTIRKMRESYRISQNEKERALALRRKEYNYAQDHGN